MPPRGHRDLGQLKKGHPDLVAEGGGQETWEGERTVGRWAGDQPKRTNALYGPSKQMQLNWAAVGKMVELRDFWPP